MIFKKKTPMNEERSISNRIFTLTTCVFISAGIVLMAALFIGMQRTILQQERRQMMAIAQSTGRSMDNYLTGCMTAATLVQEAPSFAASVTLFRQTGDPAPVMAYLGLLESGAYPAVRDVYLLGETGDFLLGTAPPDEYTGVVNSANPPDDGKLRMYKARSGDLFLGIVTKVDNSRMLTLIDTAKLYHSTSSFVTLGQKGYVMYKHSGGLILTHPVDAQVGTDVIGGRRNMYPDLDYADLERLVANQKKGEENIEVYHSYWWADDVPTRVKKISAYTPVRVQDDFLIISAVTDYAEMWQPIMGSSSALIAAGVLVTLGVMALLLNRRRETQEKIKRENAYLKELTRSMDEVNRRQEELQHNQRLQLIGTLTGGIAHEFRNLLTPIMGYSGMLRESLPPDSPFREDIDEIHTAAARAKEIIQQITSLSRKNLDPALKRVQLDSFVSRVLKVAATTKPAGVEMEYHIDFGGAEIMGNKTQLQQIILNLCNNAFQAISSGRGHVRVDGETRNENGARYAVLRFHDNGAGMEQGVLERIFDPFFTTKRVGEGTGLGLPVVQNLVDLHHGEIEVESEPGRGTTFTLRFPAAFPDSAGSARNGAVLARNAEDPISIVLVEDDPQVLRMLHRGLARSGFSTQAFEDPLDALREMEQNPCRLLITDHSMPRMTGSELAMRVRGISKKTKILMLTGFAAKEVFSFMQQEIIDGYQIKPVPVSELVEKINALFS